MVKQFNGYLGSASRSGTKGSQRSGSWTIRIPSTGYGSFVKAISTIGELESSSQDAQDVSEEFYDVQARALSQRRAYVNAEDVEALAFYVFGHRLELAPGAGRSEEVIAACCKQSLERLAKSTLRR